MRRRDILALVGGTAAVWPVTARTQQAGRISHIGVLVGAQNADDPESKANFSAHSGHRLAPDPFQNNGAGGYDALS